MSGQRPDGRNASQGVRLAAFAGLGLVLLLLIVLGGATLVFGPGAGSVDYPIATFDYAYDVDGETVRVVHAGGANYTADNTDRLTVTVNGTERAAFGLPVTNGTAINVADVDRGATVQVVWTRDEHRVRVGVETVGITGDDPPAAAVSRRSGV
jgi:hypothetical protein